MELLHLLAQYRTPVGNVIVQGITYLAQETIVIGIVCWLFWCANKKLAYSLGFAYFTSGLLVQGLKITFRIPRPWILDPDFEPVASAIPDATGYSFPSGHTQSITALAGTFGLYLKKNSAKILCFILIAAVMFSRMYLGVHTPADVGVSFLISFFCVLLNHYFFYIKGAKEGSEKITSILMIIVCVALSIYAVGLNRNEILPTELAQDCLKAAGAGMAFAVGYYVEKRYICFTLPIHTKEKLLRLIVGLTAALLIQKGLKPIIGTSLAASFVRYFLVVMWILVIYPLLFSRKAVSGK